MGFGNNIRGDDFVIKNYRSRFKNIENIIEFDKIKLASYVQLIKKLAKKFVSNMITLRYFNIWLKWKFFPSHSW